MFANSVQISVITAVRNSGHTISDCIASIRNQDYVAEHIIIDGASTDGTLDRIREHGPGIELVSGPDRGIYDAMNKGLALATGDVIGFLNADDFYGHGKVLSTVARTFQEYGVESCYGDVVYVDPQGPEPRIVRFWKSCSYEDNLFYRGWMPPHPTFFARRSIYESLGGFDLRHGTSGDYELMLRFLLKHRISTRYVSEILVAMRLGGVSNVTLSSRLRANCADRMAWKTNGLTPRALTLLAKPLLKIPQFFRAAGACPQIRKWWCHEAGGNPSPLGAQ
jgi:glycosyltransferase involved in cell wall biosynthesis